jgi:NADH-quinone oxidoreductase subunit J
MNFSLILLIAVPLLAVASLVLEKSVSALISFGGMMFLLGVYYLSIDLQLLGFLQIFVYTGGVVVLMLFGLSLVGEKFPETKPDNFAIFSSALFTTILAFVTLYYLPEVPEGAELVSQTEFASHLLPIFGVIVVSLIYGAVKIISVSKGAR